MSSNDILRAGLDMYKLFLGKSLSKLSHQSMQTKHPAWPSNPSQKGGGSLKHSMINIFYSENNDSSCQFLLFSHGSWSSMRDYWDAHQFWYNVMLWKWKLVWFLKYFQSVHAGKKEKNIWQLIFSDFKYLYYSWGVCHKKCIKTKIR